MIGKLKGTIDSIGEDFVILDVHGVGYVVHCSPRTLQALPRSGDIVSLAIETQVREDSIRLFGFLERRGTRLVSAPADGARRRRKSGLGHPRRVRHQRTRDRNRAAGQNCDLARAGRRPTACRKAGRRT